MCTRFLFLVLCCSLLVCNCKQVREDNTTVELITVKEMDSLLKREKIQLIDVRTSKEYAEGHIEGATNIDFWASNFTDLISTIDKSKPVAIY